MDSTKQAYLHITNAKLCKFLQLDKRKCQRVSSKCGKFKISLVFLTLSVIILHKTYPNTAKPKLKFFFLPNLLELVQLSIGYMLVNIELAKIV